MRLALYEPDIPQNTGAILRLGACLGVAVDLIEPFGFVMDDRRLRRAGMDYLAEADWTRHSSWKAFQETPRRARLVLMTTRGATAYTDFAFTAEDTILLGRETSGVPDVVHDVADARLYIPLRPGLRSLNVALTASMVLGEALRQTGTLPKDRPS